VDIVNDERVVLAVEVSAAMACGGVLPPKLLLDLRSLSHTLIAHNVGMSYLRIMVFFDSLHGDPVRAAMAVTF
jgi:hypothetical protein